MGTQRNTWTERSLFSEFLTYKGTYDLASTIDAAGVSATFTVPGAALGDMVVGFSASVSLAGITATAYVSAADTVTIRFQNESAGTVDLASATYLILVGKPSNQAFI
jgi:hypothetical protein